MYRRSFKVSVESLLFFFFFDELVETERPAVTHFFFEFEQKSRNNPIEMQHIMTTRQKIKQTINRNRIQFSSTSPSVHPLKYQRPSQDWNKRSTGTDDVFYPIDPIDLIDWWSLDRQFNRLWLGIIFFLLNEYQPSVKASKAKEEDFVMSTTAQSIQSRTTSQWGGGRNRKKMRDKVERVLLFSSTIGRRMPKKKQDELLCSLKKKKNLENGRKERAAGLS